MTVDINMLILLGSLLEMTGIYSINTILRPEYRVGTGKAVIIIVITASFTTLLNYLDISFQSFLILASYIVLLEVFVRKQLTVMIVDSTISYGIMFVLELPIIYLTKTPRIKLLPPDLESHLILSLLVLGIVLLKRSPTIDYFCTRYYRDNGKLIVTAANFFLLCCMLANIYNLQGHFLKNTILNWFLLYLVIC